MKRLAIIPLLMVFLQVNAQEKLIQYNSYYLKNIKVEELPVNRELSDFGPCIVNGKLFFTAFNDAAKEDEGKNKSDFYYQLFEVDINNKGKVTSTRKLLDGLTSEYNVGPNSFDKNTGELMVTRNNADDPSITSFKPIQKKLLNLEMVVAKKEEGKWSFDGEFNHNNKDYSVGHPAFTPSGDTLLFVSDMPGGYGETDIYMSVRLSDGWSYPKNLGPNINSPGKEFTPFVTNKGILIFASNGLESGNDFDLYYTLMDNTKDATIVKFPEPINSDFDDFGMTIDPTHAFGYLTSNRPGTGSDDIYRIEFNLPMMTFRGRVINKVTKNPVQNAKVEFDPDMVSGENVYTDENGFFEIEIPEMKIEEVTAGKDGYQTASVAVTEDEFTEVELMPEIWLEMSVRDADTKNPVPGATLAINNEKKAKTSPEGMYESALTGGKEYYIKGQHPDYLDNSITIGAEGEPGIIKATLWMYKGIPGKTYVLENIYYDFDKWDILPKSAVELDKLVNILKENKGLKVELSSYTDSRGTDEYNLWLSGKRSETAVQYIVSKGIPHENISAKSYGESAPYIANPKNEAEHRMNRRTTFTILEVGSEQPKITSVPVNQAGYGKTTVSSPSVSIAPQQTKYDIQKINVSGKNYRIQFYASRKPININSAMSEVVENFSQYGLINQEEDFLIKYQIGPFTDMDNATTIYNRIKNMGYQVMLLEYRDNNRQKMILPNGN